MSSLIAVTAYVHRPTEPLCSTFLFFGMEDESLLDAPVGKKCVRTKQQRLSASIPGPGLKLMPGTGIIEQLIM